MYAMNPGPGPATADMSISRDCGYAIDGDHVVINIAEIANKASKEARYHLQRSAQLVIALGDGTDESHARMQASLERLWPFTQEWFESDPVDAQCAAQGLAPAADSLAAPWRASVEAVLTRATLQMPTVVGHQRGGRQGVHSEYLGHLLAELQFVPRAYPGARW